MMFYDHFFFSLKRFANLLIWKLKLLIRINELLQWSFSLKKNLPVMSFDR